MAGYAVPFSSLNLPRSFIALAGAVAVHGGLAAGLVLVPPPSVEPPMAVGGFEVVDLSAFGVTHKKIRPHTPTDNAEIERFHRTLDEKLGDSDEADYRATVDEIDRIMDHYNHERLHSSLRFLRPVDFYRGKPAALQAERRRRMEQAKALRKQANLKMRQRLLPWREPRTVA